ncbi:MAG: FG-GAP repeat domain-containing protein [Pyrinomonadaceae bacterium]
MKRHYLVAAIIAFVLLLGLGVFASNGWLSRYIGNAVSGKKTGWFGRPVSEPGAVATGLDPNAPMPSGTPQLSKEFLYAGSRLLAVEDANANAAPPADLAVWRPTTGTWWVMGGQGSQAVTQGWGLPTDEPVQGDYDGDGKTDFSVFRPSTGEWYVLRSSDGGWSVWTWGLSTDKVVPADYDGDGKTDQAVFRPSNTTWYIIQSSNQSFVFQPYGLSTDTPAPADYDGDGRADIAVWRSTNSTFYSLNSGNSAFSGFTFTQSSTEPVSADYDGDGRADYAIRNGNDWIVRNSATSQLVVTAWQLATDKPVQNDYDGDGKVDIAVWRPTNDPAGTLGNWYIRQSATNNSLRQVQWGMHDDIPVPAFYRR